MTRKDYQLIAAAIAETAARAEGFGDEIMEDFAETIADELQRDNPNFDRQRFYNATNLAALHE